MTEPLYSVETWDGQLEQFTAQDGVPAIVTRSQLLAAIRALRAAGYSAHRRRGKDGNHYDNDSSVLIQRLPLGRS